jgi:hypothetical protein
MEANFPVWAVELAIGAWVYDAMAAEGTVRGTRREPWYCLKSEWNDLGRGGVKVVGPKVCPKIRMEPIRIVGLKLAVGTADLSFQTKRRITQKNKLR